MEKVIEPYNISYLQLIVMAGGNEKSDSANMARQLQRMKRFGTFDADSSEMARRLRRVEKFAERDEISKVWQNLNSKPAFIWYVSAPLFCSFDGAIGCRLQRKILRST